MMPPATAPTSVQVTSEPACAGVRCRSAGDRRQHEAEDEQVEAVHRIADGRTNEYFFAVTFSFRFRKICGDCCHGDYPLVVTPASIGLSYNY